jgi:TonB-dependent receptor
MGTGSFVKIGAKYRATDKSFDAANTTYTRGSNAATRFSLDQFGLQGEPVTSFPRRGRGYAILPTIDLDAIRTFTDANLPGPFFVLDTASTLANATLSDFIVEENVTAAYALVNIKLGRLTITPGLRYESTRLDITGFQLERRIDIVPTTRSNRYDDWLPGLIVKFEPSRETVLRLAYTRTLGRPNYAQLSPGGSVTYEGGAVAGTFDGSVSLGNPLLKPYRSDNLDASAEYYFAKGGLLSVAAFAKFIKNPIFVQGFTQNDVSFGGRQYETLDFSQARNADNGKIFGIEVAFQQQFTFLPGIFSGFGVELNATFVNSKLRLPDGRDSTFPQQSDYLYGAQLFYEKGRVEASIAYHNTGKSLLSAGDEEFEDQYNNDLRRVDAKASFEVVKNVRLFAEGQNLTDEPTRQYQGGRTDWITQNERYGRTFYIGVSASL